MFDRAKQEPILLTEESSPSHVILSAETYQQLVERLEVLEDMLLAKQADIALSQSQTVGSDQFTAALLKQLKLTKIKRDTFLKQIKILLNYAWNII